MAAVPKDVLLVGLGAVGAIYSLVLQKSGLARVTAVARSNYDAIVSQGVHFKSAKYGDIPGWKPYRLVRSVAEAADRPYDYVFVTTKAVPERIKTPEILKPLLTLPYSEKFAQPTYVIVQNGLNVERDLYLALKGLGKGEPKVLGTALLIGTNLLAPNVVEHNHFDILTIGIYRPNDFSTTANTPDEDAVLKGIGSVLEAGGSTIDIVPEIQRRKFAKNFWNVAFSSFSALTRYRLPALFRGPPKDPSTSYTPYISPVTADLIEEFTIPTIKSILQELVTLGRALGFPDSPDGLPSSQVELTIENTRKLHVAPDSKHMPSMLLDVEKGQPIEVEVIFGEVVRMARERGVAVPRIETLYALLLVVQNQLLQQH